MKELKSENGGEQKGDGGEPKKRIDRGVSVRSLAKPNPPELTGLGLGGWEGGD